MSADEPVLLYQVIILKFNQEVYVTFANRAVLVCNKGKTILSFSMNLRPTRQYFNCIYILDLLLWVSWQLC